MSLPEYGMDQLKLTAERIVVIVAVQLLRGQRRVLADQLNLRQGAGKMARLQKLLHDVPEIPNRDEDPPVSAALRPLASHGTP